MLFTIQGSVKQTEAINFEGQEDKYMSLCSSSRLSNSNYSTCKQFNTYLKKKNKTEAFAVLSVVQKKIFLKPKVP